MKTTIVFLFLFLCICFAEKGKYFWDKKYIIEGDLDELNSGRNLIYASIGCPAFTNFTVSNIEKSFTVRPENVHQIDVANDISVSSTFLSLKEGPLQKAKGMSILVVRGAESLQQDQLSRLDFLFRIPDPNNGISRLMVVFEWRVDSELEASALSSREWSTYISQRLQSSDAVVNGKAIVGRMRRFEVQTEPVPVAPLTNTTRTDLSTFIKTWGAVVAVAVASLAAYYDIQLFSTLNTEPLNTEVPTRATADCPTPSTLTDCPIEDTDTQLQTEVPTKTCK